MAEPFRAWVLPGPEGAGPPRSWSREELPGPPPVAWIRPGPEGVAGLAADLRSARYRLLRIAAREVARIAGRVGRRFLDPDDPLRREALDRLPGTAGLSAPMAREVVDGMARDWTEERLEALLEAELGDPGVLDGWRETGPEGRRVRALGPALSVHVCAGTVPGVAVTSLLRSLLLRSAVLLKPGLGDVALPVLFVRGLREHAPELARAVAVTYWPGGEESVEAAVAREADQVVVYGSDDAVASWRARLPVAVPLVAHHHRVSVALVGREVEGQGLERAARELARAAALFDQRGCVSPQGVWVERGDDGSRPARFARALAGALAEVEVTLPRGEVEPREAAAIRQLRDTAEVRAAAGADVEVWSGRSWTVIREPDPRWGTGCPGRTVTVRPVDDARELPEILAPVGRHLQTVAVTGLGDRTAEIAEGLARAGATRITSPGEAPWPGPWWHHDGRGPLRELLRWVDLDGGVP